MAKKIETTAAPLEAVWTKSSVVTLLGLMLFVALFSIFLLSKQSLRLDESQSLWQTSHSIPRLIKIVAGDVHVPLYHIILHYWQWFFGNSVFAGRMLSLIFFAATIPMVYALGMAAYARRNIALFAAFLIALSPFLNWYGSEIRMYSLLTLITVINQYFFIRLFRDRPVRKRVWLGYALSAVLGMFTHYFFALNLIIQAIFFIARRELFPQKTFVRLMAVAVLLVVLLSGWFFYVYRVGAIGQSEPQLTRPTTTNLFNAFSEFLFGFQTDDVNTILISLWPLMVLFAFLILTNDKRFSLHTSYFLLAAILPVLLVFVVSILIRPLFLARYLILAVPSLYLFISWMFSTYTREASRVLRVLLVVVMIFTFMRQATNANTPVKENFRQAADYMQQNVEPQDIIVLSAPFTIYPVEYYYKGPAAITTLPIWDRFATGAIPAFDSNKLSTEVNQIISDHQNAWLLLSYDQGYQDQIKLYFDTHFQRLQEKQFSPGLNLYEYKVRY